MPHEQCVGGVFTLTDQAGDSVNGILIGSAAVVERPIEFARDGDCHRSVGDWNGISGNGDATINWADQTFNGHSAQD